MLCNVCPGDSCLYLTRQCWSLRRTSLLLPNAPSPKHFQWVFTTAPHLWGLWGYVDCSKGLPSWYQPWRHPSMSLLEESSSVRSTAPATSVCLAELILYGWTCYLLVAWTRMYSLIWLVTLSLHFKKRWWLLPDCYGWNFLLLGQLSMLQRCLLKTARYFPAVIIVKSVSAFRVVLKQLSPLYIES